MAQGDSKKFSEYDFKSGQGAYNNSANTFSWLLVQEAFADINADVANPVLADFTAVTPGGNYTGKTALTGAAWARVGAVSALNFDDISMAADEANPTTARCLLIINDTSAADDALRVTDLTTDGTTPANLTQGLTVQFDADGAVQVTTNA